MIGMTRLFLIFLTVACGLSIAHADGDVASGKSELGTFSIQHENDLFAGTDHYYSSGLRIS